MKMYSDNRTCRTHPLLKTVYKMMTMETVTMKMRKQKTMQMMTSNCTRPRVRFAMYNNIA